MNRVLLFTLLAVGLCACASTREITPLHHSAGAPIEFIIVQLNDVYEISPLDGGRVGGLARVATVIRQLKEKNPNTISMLSGDFLSPSLISSLSEVVDGKKKRIAGAHMVATLNAMGLDYVTFGNHEFDVSAADLQLRLDESDFTYFSSNVMQQKEGQPPAPFMQRGIQVPAIATHTFKTEAGEEVNLGLISVTLPFNQAPYVHYDDVYASAKSAFDAAKTNHDLVFALTHLTIEEDQQLARTIPDLPFIIGGHEHTDSLSTVGNTRIAKADANARTIYIHWIKYDPGTSELDIWSQLMPITADIKPDPHTAEVVAAWEQKATALIGAMGYAAKEVITTLTTPLDGREGTIRNGQTNLGRLITCAMRYADEQAEFAFINSGSIRIDDKLDGQIQQRDVLRTLPFGGTVVHGSFKGDVLKKVLDAGLIANKDSGGYFQITGNVVNTDGIYLLNGAPIDENTTYEAVLPEFLSLGLEEHLDFMDEEASYSTITGGPVSNLDIRNLLIEYLKKADWVNDCSFAGITQF